jgi:rhodanese-related sulfurtransferase
MTSSNPPPSADPAEPSDVDPTKQALQRARERAARLGLRYAGALTPPEAWALVNRRQAKLIDVRGPAETHFVGHVQGSLLIEWTGPAPNQVEAFVGELRKLVAPTDTLAFLCRSGARSHLAAQAAAAAGFDTAFNVLEGFEGQRDSAQQRGKIDGWRKHGLPWIQD